MQLRIEPEDNNSSSPFPETPQKLESRKRITSNFFLPPLHPTDREILQPQKFTLDLPTLIKEKTDKEWHGRVGAYEDNKFQLLNEKPVFVMEKRTPFKTYFTSIVNIINEAQRIKYSMMKHMINILSKVYESQIISLNQHNDFCHELLFNIDIAMCTSPENFNQIFDTACRAVSDTPISIIEQFWNHLPFKFKLNEEKTKVYVMHYNAFIEHCDVVLMAKEKSNQIMSHFLSRKFESSPCFNWSYIAVLFNVFDIDESKFQLFKKDYQKNCLGLAADLVYLPDMWDFVNNANRQPLNSTKETLVEIDKMLKKQKGLQEFKPTEQSKLMIGIGKML